ncbi:MAG TPA: ABC transporter ATP-binding protein [Candidatus Avidesulfovibrio excrementigallinarum]|nr:ABC transporter ATP-binding protein [Candidatus Avidesulfovibrio excrementigallinarum]
MNDSPVTTAPNGLPSQYTLEQVWKRCEGPTETVTILQGVDLTVAAGEQIAITGASGSGKSTLLHLMGALDVPSSGKVLFEGQDLAAMSANEKAHWRNRRIGFVFQFHHLLPEFTTQENVAMQALIAGMPKAEAMARAEAALAKVGLHNRVSHRVTTLSGGERQRAAIARAILLEPAVLLADEPTGNLDQKTGEAIAELLLQLNQTLAMTLVVVTHNLDMALAMRRCLELRTGVLYEKNR